MSKHIEVKHKIKEESKSDFLNMLDELMLSEQEEQMMKMYYIKKLTMMQIADELGYSEIGIIKMHNRILNKIAKII